MTTPTLSYFYRISVKRVKDGDTLEAIFDLGFRASLVVTVRLLNVDAPETWRPKTVAEGDAGKKVTAFLEEILYVQQGNLYCQSHSIDVYGRSLGTLFFKDRSGNLVNINEMLVEFMTTQNLTQEQFRTEVK